MVKGSIKDTETERSSHFGTAILDSGGNVGQGLAPTNLVKYNTTLTGNSYRVYS